jgi:hypothetical protein
MGVDPTGAISATPDAKQVTEPLEKAVRSGASWFYWIAALSVVNSAIQLSGSDRSFVVGLGITQVFDAVATGATQGSEGNAGSVLRGIALVLDLMVAGFFVLIGWQAGKQRAWAFVIGMLLYACDALIFVLVQDWMSIGFHAFALFGVWGGYASIRKLREAEVQLGLRAIGPGASPR